MVAVFGLAAVLPTILSTTSTNISRKYESRASKVTLDKFRIPAHGGACESGRARFSIYPQRGRTVQDHVVREGAPGSGERVLLQVLPLTAALGGVNDQTEHVSIWLNDWLYYGLRRSFLHFKRRQGEY